MPATKTDFREGVRERERAGGKESIALRSHTDAILIKIY